MHLFLAQINPTVGDLEGNFLLISAAIEKAKKEKAALVLFPEMALLGYPPEDLLLLPHFIQEVDKYVEKVRLLSDTIAIVLGAVRKNTGVGKPLFNTAYIFQDKKLLGCQDKTLLPTYGVFDERRYFEPAKTHSIFSIGKYLVGITICEDIWVSDPELLSSPYEENPLQKLQELKVDLLLNLSASPFHQGKQKQRLQVAQAAAKWLHSPVVLCNQVGGNDSLIFDGGSFALSKEGELTHLLPSFSEEGAMVDTEREQALAYVPPRDEEELYHALVLGLCDYFRKLGMKKALIGISGGVDSALVLALAVKALGKENVQALALPSVFSSSESLQDAQALCTNFSTPLEVLGINSIYEEYLHTIYPYFPDTAFGITEENLQARIRGAILMAFSNKLGALVLSCGNKSEMAMGYSTLYGDLCGGISVLGDVTKRQVYGICRWLNQEKEMIPESILSKAPSAELRPNQKDSDTLPDYEIIDNVLEGYVIGHSSSQQIAKKYGYPLALVEDLIAKIHRSEYKRRQTAPALCISSRAFSYGRRFPIVQKFVH